MEQNDTANFGAWLQTVKNQVTNATLAFALFNPASSLALPTLPDTGNLLYWFSADTDVWSDSAATTVATDGADVLLWRDQVTNLNVAPAATTSARSPTYVANGIGNQPSLNFSKGDGGTDSLLAGSILPSKTAKTIFVVFQPKHEIKTADPSQVLVAGWYGKEMIGLGDFHYSVNEGVVGLTSRKLLDGSSTVGVGYGPAKLSAEQPHLLTAVYNSTTQVFDLYLDGINAGNSRKYQTLDLNGFTIKELVFGARANGSLAGYEGMISEVIFYQTSLSDTNRLEVGNYLSNKYLVPTTNMAFRFSADTGVWADSGATTPATNGVDVQLWQDQSSNGVDLIPSNSGADRAATYIADGINGMPALQFNNETNPDENSPDKMQNTTYSGTLKTLFYVFQPDQAIGNSTESTQRQVLLEGGSEINIVSPHNTISNAHIGLNSSNGSVNNAWGYDPADNLDLPAYPTVLSISWRNSDGQYDIRINGASVGNLSSGTDPNAFAMNELHVGAHSTGAYGLQGMLSEIIAYDAELPVSQRNAIEQYLKGKYTAPNTYYVDSTNGNDENDGLSATSAWTKFERINKSLLIPGDTILLKRGETWREIITVPASGAPGLPITFRAYGTGNKPVIHGGRPGTSSWFGPDANSVYSMTGQTHVYFMAEDDELIIHASDASCSDGNWYWDSATSTIYYKPTTGIITDHTVELVTTYTAMRLFGNSYIDIDELTFRLLQNGIYGKAIAPNAIHHFNISNSEFHKTASGVFFLSDADLEHSDSVIRDNLFTNNRESIGVYAFANGVGTNRNILITRNTILNGGVAASPQTWSDFTTGDAEGIGLQNMSDSVISHNRLIDGFGIGAGIGMWVNADSTGKNNQYIYNYIENVFGAAFVPSGAKNSGGHTVAYNIVINAGLNPNLPYGPGWGAIRMNATQNPPTKVHNNLLIGNDINILFNGSPDNYHLFNNISYQPSGYHAFLNGRMKNNLMGNNLYFPDSSKSFSHSGYGPMNFQDWTSLTFQDSPNSIVADPNFINPEPPVDYHLRANSPAINPNIDVREKLDLGSSYLDYDDQILLWNPDIGPYEYQLTDTDTDGVLDTTEICYDGDCNDYDPYHSTTNPSGGDLNAKAIDTDGDGTNDGDEIAAGTDPLNAASGAAASAVSAPATEF